LDGESIECTHDFYWSGISGSGVFAGRFQSSEFEDGEIEIHTTHFFQVGDYLIEHLEEISLWSGGWLISSTYHGIQNPCPDTGRISIDEVAHRYIKGTFECVFNPVCGGATRYITEGKFIISRE
jgi:hypothetical protein